MFYSESHYNNYNRIKNFDISRLLALHVLPQLFDSQGSA